MNTRAVKPILIVDDSAQTVKELKQFITEFKIANPVHSVSNGADAIDYLVGRGQYGDRKACPLPGLILLDMLMPFKSGRDVLAWIQRQHDSELAKMGIIVMTSMGNIDDVREAYRMGAHTFLAKPLLKAEFRNLLDGLCGIHLESSGDQVYLHFQDNAYQKKTALKDG